MEAKPIPSFFEISINTQKFTHFTNTLNTILNAHDKVITQHTRELAQIRLSVEDKMSRIRNQLQYQWQKTQKKRKQDNQYFNTFLNDWTIKHQLFANEWRERISNFQDQHVSMKAKIDNLNDQNNEIVVKEIKKKISEMIIEGKSLLENQVLCIKNKVGEMEQQLKSSASANNFLLKNIMEAYENRAPVEKQNQINTVIQPRKNNQDNSRYMGDKGFSIEQMTVKEGRQKKKKKVQQKCEQQNLQYASISAKLDSLETRLTAKENEELNKIVWAGRKQLEVVNSEASQNSLSFSMSKIEAQRKNLQQNITGKLEHIEQIIELKFAKIEKDLIKITNIQDLLNDQMEINNRKIDKQKSKIVDLTMQIKRFQEKKFDQKLIDNLMGIMKRQNRSLEEEVQKKMPQQIYNKQKQRWNQKIQFVTQSMGEKADKQQVKRAFQFVEDKMKQIILIIADDIQQQKEGAIKRIPFKCLSCDKDLQSSLSSTIRNDNVDKKIPTRGSTSQIRKRIRVVNNQQK